jgi:hypothetical protein
MILVLEHRFCNALVEAKIAHPAFKERENHYGKVHIDAKELNPADRAIFRKVIKTDDFWKGNGSADYHKLSRIAEAVWYILETDPDHVKVKNLEVLAVVINNKFTEVRRRWVFKRDASYGWLSPFFFMEAEYHPPEKRRDYYRSAYVSAEFAATQRGRKVSFHVSFSRSSLAGHPSIAELFEEHGVVLANDKLLEIYDAELKVYREWAPKTGEQFTASGNGIESDSDLDDDDNDPFHWRRPSRSNSAVSLLIEGQAAKLVMDDADHQGNDNNTVTYTLAKDENAEIDAIPDDAISIEDIEDVYEDAEDDEDERLTKAERILIAKEAKLDASDAPAQKQKQITRKLPTHPVVRMFNLGTHEFLTCHVSDIKPYEFDTKLIDKLVLPEEHKQLVGALTSSVINKYSDIVSGKAMGIIVLCSGTPGTGKTLTAEVYSEVAKRPLYLVQCSQLGTDETQLEKTLTIVLNRASRWKAILLIDEADVYIHERGKDINQNAIVGVFLRLLEYYQGILFLTTNRAMVVDDAIISRMTAHIRYTVPENDDRNRLWKILSSQYQVPMADETIKKAVEQFPKVSGRSIRQIIRLAKFMADNKLYGGRVTLETLRAAAKFHNFSEDEKMSEETVRDVQAHR